MFKNSRLAITKSVGDVEEGAHSATVELLTHTAANHHANHSAAANPSFCSAEEKAVLKFQESGDSLHGRINDRTSLSNSISEDQPVRELCYNNMFTKRPANPGKTHNRTRPWVIYISIIIILLLLLAALLFTTTLLIQEKEISKEFSIMADSLQRQIDCYEKKFQYNACPKENVNYDNCRRVITRKCRG